MEIYKKLKKILNLQMNFSQLKKQLEIIKMYQKNQKIFFVKN